MRARRHISLQQSQSHKRPKRVLSPYHHALINYFIGPKKTFNLSCAACEFIGLDVCILIKEQREKLKSASTRCWERDLQQAPFEKSFALQVGSNISCSSRGNSFVITSYSSFVDCLSPQASLKSLKSSISGMNYFTWSFSSQEKRRKRCWWGKRVL